MANRSTPNTPVALKPLKASKLRAKRKSTQKRLSKKITPARTATVTAGVSAGRVVKRSVQSVQRAAPLSKKKARKVERQRGYARERERVERGLDREGEVVMKDVDEEKAKTRRGKGKEATVAAGSAGAEDVGMEID